MSLDGRASQAQDFAVDGNIYDDEDRSLPTDDRNQFLATRGDAQIPPAANEESFWPRQAKNQFWPYPAVTDDNDANPDVSPLHPDAIADETDLTIDNPDAVDRSDANDAMDDNLSQSTCSGVIRRNKTSRRRPVSHGPETEASVIGRNVTNSGTRQIGVMDELEYVERCAAYSSSRIEFPESGATQIGFKKTQENDFFTYYGPRVLRSEPRDMVSEVGSASQPGAGPTPAKSADCHEEKSPYEPRRYGSEYQLPDGARRTTDQNVHQWLYGQVTEKVTEMTDLIRGPRQPLHPDHPYGVDMVGPAEGVGRGQNTGIVPPFGKPAATFRSRQSVVSSRSTASRIGSVKSKARRLDKDAHLRSVSEAGSHESSVIFERVLEVQRELGDAQAAAKFGEEKLQIVSAAQDEAMAAKTQILQKDAAAEAALLRKDADAALLQKDADAALLRKDADAEAALLRKDAQMAQKEADAKIAVEEAKRRAAEDMNEKLQIIAGLSVDLAELREKSASIEAERKRVTEVAKLREEQANELRARATTQPELEVAKTTKELIQSRRDLQVLQLKMDSQRLNMEEELNKRDKALLEAKMMQSGEDRRIAETTAIKEANDNTNRIALEQSETRSCYVRNALTTHANARALSTAQLRQAKHRSRSEPKGTEETGVKIIATEPSLPVIQQSPDQSPPLSPRHSVRSKAPSVRSNGSKRTAASKSSIPRRERHPSLASSEIYIGDDASSYNQSRCSRRRRREEPQGDETAAQIYRKAAQDLAKKDLEHVRDPLRISPVSNRSLPVLVSPAGIPLSASLRHSTPANHTYTLDAPLTRVETVMMQTMVEMQRSIKKIASRTHSARSSPTKPPGSPITSRKGGSEKGSPPGPIIDMDQLAEQLAKKLQPLVTPSRPISPTVILNGSYVEESEPAKPPPRTVGCSAVQDGRSVVVNAQPMQLSQIPTFAQEEDGTTFPEWVLKFDRILALTPTVATPEMKARILPTKLAGMALTAYDTQPRAVQEDYDAIKAALTEWFSYKDENEYPSWLKSEQKRGESVRNYLARLQKAQKEVVGEEATHHSNQVQLKQVFIEGLRKDLRSKLLALVPETWKKIVDRAIYLERCAEKEKENLRSLIGCVGEADYEDLIPGDDESVSATMVSVVTDFKERTERLERELAEIKKAKGGPKPTPTTGGATVNPSGRTDEEEAAALGHYIMDTCIDSRTAARAGPTAARGRGGARPSSWFPHSGGATMYTGSPGFPRGGRGGGGRGGPTRSGASGGWRGGSAPLAITAGPSSSLGSGPSTSAAAGPPDEWATGKPVCAYCSNIGHIQKYCRKWAKYIEDKNDARTQRVMQSYIGPGTVVTRGGKPAGCKAVGLVECQTIADEGEVTLTLKELTPTSKSPGQQQAVLGYAPNMPTVMEEEGMFETPVKEIEETNNTVASVHTRLRTSRMYVNVTMNQKPMTALVDTGASISIISERAAKKCIPAEDIQKTDRDCQSASDHDIPMVGKAVVKMKVGDKEYDHCLYIAKGFSSELLLGDDWIVKAECSLVYRQNKRTMIIDGQQVKTRTGVVSDDVHAAYQVALINQYRMPARTMTSISFNLPEKESKDSMQFDDGDLVYVEPLPRELFEDDVVVPKCITRVKDGIISVPVMNVSTADVAVPAGAYLMQVEAFNPDVHSIQEIDLPDPKETKAKKHTKALEALTEKVREWVLEEIPTPVVPGVSFEDSDLTEEQRHMFAYVLSLARDAFAENDLELGMTKDVEHDIDTGTTPPIRQHPYRVPFHFREEFEKMLKDMMAQDVIEPSKSPWASPVVLVKKKDGKMRFCVDYRKVNAITRKDSYPLPRIDELLDSLNLVKFFTSIDLQSGFWQIPMTKGARAKTAFTCHMGLFEFTKMPFGLTSAPATFQRLMDCVLSGLAGLICLVFLDDVIIFTKTTVEQHMYDVLRVLRTLANAGLKIKGRKCKIARKVLQFLGHLVSAEGIAPDPEKIKAIMECVPPKNVHEVRVFLGLVGFYRKFIENCASICACMTKLLQKGVDFNWTTACQKAFDVLKMLLCTAPILAYPDLRKPFVLYTDASGMGLGSVLAQNGDDNREHVISYASRTLRKYEVGYGITELEMLAVIWSMGHYRPYLLGTETKIITDHKATHWILHKKKPKCAVSMRLTRWAMLMQDYDYVVEYRPGRKLRNADALSRPPIVQHSKGMKDFDFDPATWNVREEEEGTDELGLQVPPIGEDLETPRVELEAQEKESDKEAAAVDVADAVPSGPDVAMLSSFTFPSVTNEQLREEQLADPECAALIRNIEDKTEPDDENLGLYVGRARRWHSVDQGVLYHIVKRRKTTDPDPAYEPTEQVVVPAHLQDALIASYHSGKLAGHLGHDKIFHPIARKYYWRNCYDDIRRHCQGCVTCAEYNVGSRRKTKLYPTEVTSPFYRVFVDFEGPMPETPNGNQYILVFIDSFTKFPICVPTKDQTAETAAEAMIRHVVLEQGCPVEVLSDQGPAFASEVCRRVCAGLGIKKTFSTPYHPQTMGQVENLNKIVLNMLKKMLDGEDDKWDVQLPYVLFAYRSAVHASMKDSPFHAVYGRDPLHPHDLLLLPEIPADDPPFAKEIQERMSRAWTSVREELFVSKDKMAEYYNRNVINNRVKVGDNVVKQIFVHKGRNRKLVPTFEAMYRVISADPPNIVIQKWGEPISKRHEVHENLVKVYKGTWLEPPLHTAAKRQLKARRSFLKKKFNCYKCYKRTIPGCDDDAIDWIHCDYCRGWFHWNCVGLKRKPRTLNWFCPDCKSKGILREGDPLDGYQPEEEQGEDLTDEETADADPSQPSTSGRKQLPPPVKIRRAKKRGGPIETDSEAEREQQREQGADEGGESDSSASTVTD